MSGIDRRNVVLVSIDSLRADHCGFLGSEYDTTPNIDNLVTDGVVYETAISPGPRTPSSMPVAFTGQFPDTLSSEMGNWRARRQRIASHLTRHKTLTEQFSERGYATAGFTMNPWTDRDTGFDHGFDKFVQSPSNKEAWSVPVRVADRLIRVTRNKDRFNWHNKQEWLAQWPQFEPKIESLINDLEEPYFLWIFLLDTHQPYIAPSSYREENTGLEMYYAAFQYWNHLYRGNSESLPDSVDRRLQRAYRDTIRSVDAFVGHLSRKLESSNPAIVVHSDHGEAFGEHGTYGHQQALYEENIRVPLIVIDGKDHARIDSPISLRSLPSLVTAVSRSERFEPETPFVIAETEEGSAVAVRGRRWKYIADGDEKELFDLQRGPGERESRTKRQSGLAESLDGIIRKHHTERAERQAVRRAIETIDGKVTL